MRFADTPIALKTCPTDASAEYDARQEMIVCRATRQAVRLQGDTITIMDFSTPGEMCVYQQKHNALMTALEAFYSMKQAHFHLYFLNIPSA